MNKLTLIVIFLGIVACSPETNIPDYVDPPDLFISWASDTGTVTHTVTQKGVEAYSVSREEGPGQIHHRFTYLLPDGGYFTLDFHSQAVGASTLGAALKSTIKTGKKPFNDFSGFNPGSVDIYYTADSISPQYNSWELAQTDSLSIDSANTVEVNGQDYLEFGFNFSVDLIDTRQMGDLDTLELYGVYGLASFKLNSL